MAVSDYVFVQITDAVGRGDVYWLIFNGRWRDGGACLDSARWDDGGAA